MIKLNELIHKVESYILDVKKGLPDDIFYFISRTTPLVNVDLIVFSSKKKILFTWRDDKYAGKGWHLPGGIIRFKEDMVDRVKIVAKKEIGIELNKIEGPIDIKQIIDETKTNRAHFISLLFKCYIDEKNENIIKYKVDNDSSNYMLSKGIPKNLLSWHNIYKDYF